MDVKQYRELKNELESDYFLISKRAFWGGLLGVLVAVAGVGWGTVQTVINHSVEGRMINRIEEGARLADQLIGNNRTLPDGSVILIDTNTPCPEGSLRISNLGFLTLTDPNWMTDEMISRTQQITVESTHGPENKYWDRRQFQACLFAS